MFRGSTPLSIQTVVTKSHYNNFQVLGTIDDMGTATDSPLSSYLFSDEEFKQETFYVSMDVIGEWK